MRTLFIACLATVLLAGCNSDRGARREVALLRAELLELEDRYYALKYQPGDRSGILGTNLGTKQTSHQHVFSNDSNYCDGCGQFVDSVSPSTMYEDAGWGGSIPDSVVPFEGSNPPLNYEPLTVPQSRPSPNQITPEEIDPSPPSGTDSSGLRNNRIPANRVSANSIAQSQNTNRSSAKSAPAASNVFDLILIESKSQGRDQNGDGIDDGLQVSFGLVDTDGFLVEEAAQIVISLLDPALPSGQQRLGLWEHTTIKKSPMLRARPDDKPDQVFVQWQNQQPSHSDLLLFVRHILPDGTALENSIPVRVKTGREESDLLNLEPPQDDRTTSRDSSPAPEITVDINGLENGNGGSNDSNQRRRPAWRAIR